MAKWIKLSHPRASNRTEKLACSPRRHHSHSIIGCRGQRHALLENLSTSRVRRPRERHRWRAGRNMERPHCVAGVSKRSIIVGSGMWWSLRSVKV